MTLASLARECLLFKDTLLVLPQHERDDAGS